VTELDIHFWLTMALLALAVAVFVVLQFVTAPYGKFTRAGWGPKINRTAGWVVQEAPSVLIFAWCFAVSDRTTDPLAIVFLVMWLVHYGNRTFVFPFRLRGGRSNMTLLPFLMAIVFTAANGYINGRWLYTLGPAYPASWWLDPRFIGGTALFVLGFAINQHSDWVLIRLRKPGESGYKIPRGGAFELVSCANYLGELLEWTGWAVGTWSLPGLAFAAFTAANLIPRARAQHRWYIETFGVEYPERRRAVIPFVY